MREKRRKIQNENSQRERERRGLKRRIGKKGGERDA